jgi:deglycase
VCLVSIKEGKVQGFIHDEKADTFKVDALAKTISARDFDALVIPGGLRNIEALRANPDAVKVVREFMESDKPVAAICHAPRLLIEADAVEGRTLTSDEEIADEVRDAGGSWVDRAVQVDQKLLTGRKPEDLPAFCANLVGLLSDRRAPSRQDGRAILPRERSTSRADLAWLRLYGLRLSSKSHSQE